VKAFWRVFYYIWPQWPRIVVVVVSTLIGSVLLSLSFMSLIPLLKVMMGQEGLHGWVDRKVCQWRYGISFYVPESIDFTRNNGPDIGYYLLVTSVDDDGPADKAGIKPADRIIGAGSPVESSQETRVVFTMLLEAFATSRLETIDVRLKRLDEQHAKFGEKFVELENVPAGDFKDRVGDFAQWAVSFIPRDQTQDNRTKAVAAIIVAVGVLTVIRCLAKFYQSYLAEKVVHVGVNRLREDAFAHVMDMPVGFFDGDRPSDSVSRMVHDTGAMGNGIKILLGKGLREPLNAILLLVVAALLNWQLTLIFLCAGPPILWLVARLGKKMKRASKRSLKAWSQMLSKLQEVVAGLKVVKVYNQQAYEQSAFKVINKRLLKQLLKMSKVDSATNPIMEVVAMVAGSIALVVGASWVTQNHMEGPNFLVLLGLLGAAGEAVRKTGDIYTKIQQANGAAERVFSMMDQPRESFKDGTIELPTLRQRIEFRNITFTYPGASDSALKGINLVVQAGHNIAIVGPNGSGKTTLANLMPRFYDPDSGQILIDGTDIKDATLRSLRNQIAMVTQQMAVFNDTIAANIAYGKANAGIEETTAAARRAFAHEFVELLPDGYDTIIGEQGTGLSGGQIQRIIIARAILKNPSILIFDEATSQVDADSEAKIHKAIEEIMHDRTSFVIAHRFSTIIAADVIVVMDKGRIVAQGQHEELMQNCPLYQSLYETQLVKT